jgi:hypothetical protein
MKQNMGDLDRTIRMVAGAVILLLAMILPVIPGIGGIVVIETILLILAAILIITALFGVCPLYFLFRISTKKD